MYVDYSHFLSTLCSSILHYLIPDYLISLMPITLISSLFTSTITLLIFSSWKIVFTFKVPILIGCMLF